MSKDTDWTALYQEDPEDAPHGRSRPPIWVVVVVAVSVVAGGWLLVSQESTDIDPATSPTLVPVTLDEGAAVTTTTFSANETDPVSVFGNPPIAVIPDTPRQLRGYVAVTSPDDPPLYNSTVWVFRPGGSLVSRSDAVIGRGNVDYPMLITSGRLIVGGRIFDIDLGEPPMSLWTDGHVFPGSLPGVVWLAGPQGGPITDDYLWISKVDVDSLTVGERLDITDLFARPVAGAADGMAVVGFEGEFAFWSPTDGLLSPPSLRGPLDRVVAASRDLVAVDSLGRVTVNDIAKDEYLVWLDFDSTVPVTSACLSPDGQHVIVVWSNGEAAVANTTTGEVIDLNEAVEHYEDLTESIQQEHGIGWTANDQLVFIAEGEGSKNVFGYDMAIDESFHVATLGSPAPWWLAASETMC